VKAGFKPRVVDVDPRTLDVDHAQLESMPLDRVLAIVATGLYGMPGDLPRLERFARDRGVFLVDDAAQAMGARVGGRLCGTFGDAGLFSLDKGKNVSAIDGGVLVTSSAPVAAALAEETTRLALPSFGHEAAWYVKLMAYAALLHPRLYWMPNSVPQLQLGKTVYTTEYPMALPGGAAAALGTAVLPRLAALNARRRDNARCLLAELEGISGIQTVEPVPDGEPAPAGAGARFGVPRSPCRGAQRTRHRRDRLLPAFHHRHSRARDNAGERQRAEVARARCGGAHPDTAHAPLRAAARRVGDLGHHPRITHR
jgi:dTDP-4-amino-4,6-dideoxygalactose transaminase